MQCCRLLTSFQEGLEGDRGRDRVQRCHFFNIIPRMSTPEIVLSMIFQNSASKMANCIIVDIVNYSNVITGKLLATPFYLSLKYGVRMRA